MNKGGTRPEAAQAVVTYVGCLKAEALGRGRLRRTAQSAELTLTCGVQADIRLEGLPMAICAHQRIQALEPWR